MEARNDFDFYLKFTKPLVLNLPKVADRVLAAAWVKRLIDDQEANEETKLHYLMILLFLLQRRTISNWVFKKHPSAVEALEKLPENKPLVEVAKEILEGEWRERNEKVKLRINGESGDFPPYETDFSSDLLEYIAVQKLEDFGVHAYYAISKQPLNAWDRIDKMFLPKAVKSLVEVTTRPAGLEGASSSPELGAKAPEKTPDKKKEAARSPCHKKKSTLGASPPAQPIGKVVPEPEDRSRPTWGSNLLKVQEATFIEQPPEELWTSADSVPYRTPPVPHVTPRPEAYRDSDDVFADLTAGIDDDTQLLQVQTPPSFLETSDSDTTPPSPQATRPSPGDLPTSGIPEAQEQAEAPGYNLTDFGLEPGEYEQAQLLAAALPPEEAILTSEEAQQILKDAQAVRQSATRTKSAKESKQNLKRKQDIEAHKTRLTKHKQPQKVEKVKKEGGTEIPAFKARPAPKQRPRPTPAEASKTQTIKKEPKVERPSVSPRYRVPTVASKGHVTQKKVLTATPASAKEKREAAKGVKILTTVKSEVPPEVIEQRELEEFSRLEQQIKEEMMQTGEDPDVRPGMGAVKSEDVSRTLDKMAWAALRLSPGDISAVEQGQYADLMPLPMEEEDNEYLQMERQVEAEMRAKGEDPRLRSKYLKAEPADRSMASPIAGAQYASLIATSPDRSQINASEIAEYERLVARLDAEERQRAAARLEEAYKNVQPGVPQRVSRTPPLFSKHKSVRDAARNLTYAQQDFGLDEDVEWYPAEEYFGQEKLPSPKKNTREELRLQAVFPELQYAGDETLFDMEAPEDLLPPSPDKTVERLKAIANKYRKEADELSPLPITSPRSSISPARPANMQFLFDSLSPPPLYQSPQPTPESPPIDSEAFKKKITGATAEVQFEARPRRNLFASAMEPLPERPETREEKRAAFKRKVQEAIPLEKKPGGKRSGPPSMRTIAEPVEYPDSPVSSRPTEGIPIDLRLKKGRRRDIRRKLSKRRLDFYQASSPTEEMPPEQERELKLRLKAELPEFFGSPEKNVENLLKTPEQQRISMSYLEKQPLQAVSPLDFSELDMLDGSFQAESPELTYISPQMGTPRTPQRIDLGQEEPPEFEPSPETPQDDVSPMSRKGVLEGVLEELKAAPGIIHRKPMYLRGYGYPEGYLPRRYRCAFAMEEDALEVIEEEKPTPPPRKPTAREEAEQWYDSMLADQTAQGIEPHQASPVPYVSPYKTPPELKRQQMELKPLKTVELPEYVIPLNMELPPSELAPAMSIDEGFYYSPGQEGFLEEASPEYLMSPVSPQRPEDTQIIAEAQYRQLHSPGKRPHSYETTPPKQTIRYARNVDEDMEFEELEQMIEKGEDVDRFITAKTPAATAAGQYRQLYSPGKVPANQIFSLPKQASKYVPEDEDLEFAELERTIEEGGDINELLKSMREMSQRITPPDARPKSPTSPRQGSPEYDMEAMQELGLTEADLVDISMGDLDAEISPYVSDDTGDDYELEEDDEFKDLDSNIAQYDKMLEELEREIGSSNAPPKTKSPAERKKAIQRSPKQKTPPQKTPPQKTPQQKTLQQKTPPRRQHRIDVLPKRRTPPESEQSPPGGMERMIERLREHMYPMVPQPMIVGGKVLPYKYKLLYSKLPNVIEIDEELNADSIESQSPIKTPPCLKEGYRVPSPLTRPTTTPKRLTVEDIGDEELEGLIPYESPEKFEYTTPPHLKREPIALKPVRTPRTPSPTYTRPLDIEPSPYLVPTTTPPLFEEGFDYSPEAQGVLEEDMPGLGSPVSPLRPEDSRIIADAQYQQLLSPKSKAQGRLPSPKSTIKYVRQEDEDREFEELEKTIERGDDVEQILQSMKQAGKRMGTSPRPVSPASRQVSPAPRPVSPVQTLTAMSPKSVSPAQQGSLEYDMDAMKELELTEADLADISMGDLDAEISPYVSDDTDDYQVEEDDEFGDLDQRISEYDKMLEELEQETGGAARTPPKAKSRVKARSPVKTRTSPRTPRTPPQAISPREDFDDSPPGGMERMIARLREHMEPMFPQSVGVDGKPSPYKYKFEYSKLPDLVEIDEEMDVSSPKTPENIQYEKFDYTTPPHLKREPVSLKSVKTPRTPSPTYTRPLHIEPSPYLVPATTPPLFEEGFDYSPEAQGVLEEDMPGLGSPVSPFRPEDSRIIADAQYQQLLSPKSKAQARLPSPKSTIKYVREEDEDREFEELEKTIDRGEDVEQILQSMKQAGKRMGTSPRPVSPASRPVSPAPRPVSPASRQVSPAPRPVSPVQTLTAMSPKSVSPAQQGSLEYDMDAMKELGLTEADLADISMGDLDAEMSPYVSDDTDDYQVEEDDEFGDLDQRISEYDKMLEELEQETGVAARTPPKAKSRVKARSPVKTRTPPRTPRTPAQAISPREDFDDSPPGGMERMIARLREHMEPMFPQLMGVDGKASPYKYKFEYSKLPDLVEIDEEMDVSSPKTPENIQYDKFDYTTPPHLKREPVSLKSVKTPRTPSPTYARPLHIEPSPYLVPATTPPLFEEGFDYSPEAQGVLEEDFPGEFGSPTSPLRPLESQYLELYSPKSMAREIQSPRKTVKYVREENEDGEFEELEQLLEEGADVEQLLTSTRQAPRSVSPRTPRSPAASPRQASLGSPVSPRSVSSRTPRSPAQQRQDLSDIDLDLEVEEDDDFKDLDQNILEYDRMIAELEKEIAAGGASKSPERASVPSRRQTPTARSPSSPSPMPSPRRTSGPQQTTPGRSPTSPRRIAFDTSGTGASPSMKTPSPRRSGAAARTPTGVCPDCSGRAEINAEEMALPFGGRTSPGILDTSPINIQEIPEDQRNFRWMNQR